jgi:hypothetical protein
MRLWSISTLLVTCLACGLPGQTLRADEKTLREAYHDFDPAYWRSEILKPTARALFWVPPEDSPFVRHKTPKAIPLLRILLQDKDSVVRIYASICTAYLGREGRPLIPELARLLPDADPHTRQTALYALAALGAKEETASIAKLLRDEEPNVRYAAAKSLMKLDKEKSAADVLPVLAELINRRDFDGWNAVATIGKYDFDNPVVCGALVKTLLSTDPRDEPGVRAIEAARAIGQAKKDVGKAISALEQATKDKRIDVRACVACALWELTKDTDKTLPIMLDYCRAHGDRPIIDETVLIGPLVAIGKKDPRAIEGLTVLSTTGLDDLEWHLQKIEEKDKRVAELVREKLKARK